MRVGFWFGQSGLRDGKWELAEGDAEETRTPSSGPWMWRGEETGAQLGQCLHRWQRWERCHSVKQYAENVKLRHSCTGTLVYMGAEVKVYVTSIPDTGDHYVSIHPSTEVTTSAPGVSEPTLTTVAVPLLKFYHKACYYDSKHNIDHNYTHTCKQKTNRQLWKWIWP